MVALWSLLSETFTLTLDFPVATALTQISRSVTMQQSLITTIVDYGINPMSLDFINSAVFYIPSSGVQQKNVLLMMSFIFIKSSLLAHFSPVNGRYTSSEETSESHASNQFQD